MKTIRFIITAIFLTLLLPAEGQDIFMTDNTKPVVPIIFYKKAQKEFYKGDSITVIILPEVPVYPPLKFKNRKDYIRYNKLIYNVKKTLPIAKKVNQTIAETYEYLEKLPNKKAKDAHIKAVEKGIKQHAWELPGLLIVHQAGPEGVVWA